MTLFALILLAMAVLSFSLIERRLWGSGRTPFALVAYPLLGAIALAAIVTPQLGFFRPQAGTVLVAAIGLTTFALASVAVRSLAPRTLPEPALEDHGARLAAGETESAIGSPEYIAVTVLLGTLFLAQLLGGEITRVEKGELGVGGIKGHIIQLGMAYLVIALSQRRGQLVVRGAFITLILWILAFNQVKYLIFLPVSGALLYRWVSGQLPTWKLVAIALAIPMGVVVIVYVYFGVAAAAAGVLSWPLLLELGRHMVSYVVSGVLGLDQLLREAELLAFGADGLRYAFAWVENTARFVAGAGDYFNLLNPLYLDIEATGRLESNVYTLFGSLLYRAGWLGGWALALAYGAVSYAIWARWRSRAGPVACALGSWWLAPLLFAWHDPFFPMLSVIEISVILWLRAQLPWRSAY